MVIAEAWERLGEVVAPLSNAAGRPLARTMKLIIEPLVLRPHHDERFRGPIVTATNADDLRRLIADHGAVLTATASWYLLVKRVRRRSKVTEGNPQDLYFQRCFELAHLHGHPDSDPDGADKRAAELVAEVAAERGGNTVATLRDFLTDPDHHAALTARLAAAWRGRMPHPVLADGQASDLERFLASCPDEPDGPLLDRLTAQRVGSAAAAGLDRPGVARDHGMTDRRRVEQPVIGDRASKRELPRPFDRSILERIFSGVGSNRGMLTDLRSVTEEEIDRSAAPWQLSDEYSRITMALAVDTVAGIGGTDSSPPGHPRRRLRSRWQREAYVHRLGRLPRPQAELVPADLREEITSVRQPYLRRLWVRLHGRELRREPVDSHLVWDLLDGVFRSVILDQRDRLRGHLERGLP